MDRVPGFSASRVRQNLCATRPHLPRIVGRGVAVLGLAGLAACAPTDPSPLQNSFLQQGGAGQDAPMRWDSRSGSDAWTVATFTAIETHGDAMVAQVPRDVAEFCPGYAAQDEAGRSAFWAGLMSSLAKHESTWNPRASGGGGKWLGLMQISPATWRGYGCTGEMFNGADNMACAIKIASRQVGRDNAVVGGKGNWRGIARDWAPMRSAAKRADIAAWTAAQPYCAAQG